MMDYSKVPLSLGVPMPFRNGARKKKKEKKKKKSCRRNAVEVAVLLPVVKAAAKDGKHPFYESRRGLNQGHVFGYVVTARDFPLPCCLFFM